MHGETVKFKKQHALLRSVSLASVLWR